jgi:hypothetical protein
MGSFPTSNTERTSKGLFVFKLKKQRYKAKTKYESAVREIM